MQDFIGGRGESSCWTGTRTVRSGKVDAAVPPIEVSDMAGEPALSEEIAKPTSLLRVDVGGGSEEVGATSNSFAGPARSKGRAQIGGITRNLFIAAASLLVIIGISRAADPDTHIGGVAAVVSQLPADHPVGTNASVTLVSLKRAPGLHEPILSTFIVAYGPGGSAVLHRAPTSGYVLVHVLSGTIQAQAWEAGMGVYLSGQTWVEPAFANDITTKNASAVEPARALVVLVTSDTGSWEPKDK